MTQKPRSHITLVPFGGLGNRLKAISAGIKLARQTHSDIDIYWVVDSGLACRFDQLFLPIDTDGVRLIEAPPTTSSDGTVPAARTSTAPTSTCSATASGCLPMCRARTR